MGLKLKKIQLGGEIRSIELLRGLASAMVCFFHLTHGNPRYLPESSLFWRAGNGTWAGVEIFFVISGFIIPYAMFNKNYSIADFPLFLKKRIIRIEPPYLISIVLVLVLNFVSTLSPLYRGAPFAINWGNLAGHLIYYNAFTGATWLNPVYWSLAIEFQYYLLIAFSFGLIVSGKYFYRILFFALFAATSFLDVSLNAYIPYNGLIFSYAGYFLAGILLFQWVCGIIGRKEFAVLTTITAALLFYKNGAGLALLTGGTMLVIAYVNEVPRFLRYLGMISYSLYLVHVPIGGRIINIAEVKVHSVPLREGIVILTFFICILAAHLFYRLIEKPFKKLAAGIRYDENRVVGSLPNERPA